LARSVAKLFFLLSGEHETLPVSELEAILEAEGHKYSVVGQLRQVARFEASVNCLQSVVHRAALTRVCCAEVFCTKAETEEILKQCRLASFEKHLKKGKSFVVRVRRIGESAPKVDSVGLERKIGAVIWDRVEGVKVSLTRPDVTFFGVLTGGFFVLGRKLAEIIPKAFVLRGPRRRPFFHPSAMPAKLARCMVNLAQPVAGEVVLDPFCGTGAMLIEAGLMGCRVVGFDVQWRMVRGSLRNLRHFGIKSEGVLMADVRHMPVRQVDCIVTDPPYGRSAKTLGREVRDIVDDFLHVATDVVARGRRLCIAFPKGVRIGGLAEDSGFKVVESHYVYIHRSLTREVAVLERV
jgi:tRNA (guanine10-N2)-dimethyltransferase